MSGDRTMLRAKFAYAAKHDDELSFDAGVEIALLEKKENGWWRGELIGSGAVGLFPYNYVEVLQSVASPVLSPRSGSDDANKEKRRRSESKATMASTVQEQDGKERVIALEDYSSKDKQQLDFKKDDVIIVIQKFPTGWWKGELQGRVGVFPQKTVKPFGDGKGEEKSSKKHSKNRSKGSRDNTSRKHASSSSRGATHKGDPTKPAGEDTLSQISAESDNETSTDGDESTESGLSPVGAPSVPSLSLGTTKANEKDKNAHYVRALEPYQASGPGQLSFNKGDMIKVIEKKDDWWLGELNRAIGLFPVDTCEDLNPSAPASSSGSASKVGVALFEFRGSGEGQLSFSKDDKITILAKLESGWWRGELNGKVGHFPGSYVREEGSDASAAAAAVASPRASVNLSDTIGAAARQPTMKNLGAKIRAVAIHKYVGKDDNQLSFEPNDEIMVIAKAANGWWSGELRGKIGHFPGSYVKEVDGSSSDSAVPASAANTATKPAPRSAEMRRATAIYAYNAQSTSELSLKVGDELVLLPSTAADTKGWLTGYLVSNKTQVGHFPAGYVKIQEKDGASSASTSDSAESSKTKPEVVARAKTVGIRPGSGNNSDSDSGKSSDTSVPPSKPVPPVPSRASVQLSAPPIPELTTPPILTTPSAPSHTAMPSKEPPPLPSKSTSSSTETPAASSAVPTGLTRAQTTSIAPIHRDRKPSAVVPPRSTNSEPAASGAVAATLDPAVVEKAAQAATAKELEKFKTAMVKLQQQTKVAVDEMLSRIDAQQKERLKLEYVMRDMKRTLKEEKDARLRVEQQNKVLYQELTALKQKQAQTEQDSKITDEFSGMSATEMRNQIRRLTSQLDQEVHSRQDLQSFVSQLQSDIDAIKRAVGSGGSVAGRSQMIGSGHLNNSSTHSSAHSSGGGHHHDHSHHVDPDDYFYRPN